MITHCKTNFLPGWLARLLLAGALLAALLLTGCSSLSPQATPSPTPSDLEPVPSLVSATGVVVPENWTDLAFSTSGVIAEILVKKVSRYNQANCSCA